MFWAIIATYLSFFAVLYLFSDNRLKLVNNENVKFFRRLKTTSIVFVVISPILIICFFVYVLGVSFETQYDVKKGSWMWYVRMDNTILNNFPIIELVGKEKYNEIGGDNPHIGAAYSLEYISSKCKEEILVSSKSYLDKYGIELYEIEDSECWQSWNKKTDNEFYFRDVNYSKGCLELRLTELINNTVKVELFVVV